ncbi:MAG: sigma-70 family RNA polymerase sigma factor [Muribaculaceae bacterium]|nr:sigma-70 family RNA polymerase sigma factor [Muribaculaceae bacterium]
MSYTTPLDEQQLIADLQDPKTAKAAFDTLMRTYGEQIYWQIRKMVTNHDDANDLLQNTFIKAWNNLQNFRGDAKLSTWLYKIAVNETLNFLNKERQRHNVTEEGDASMLLSNLESDEYFDGDQLQVDFQKAIATLPDKQRLVFNMRYFDEMKYEKISEILGTSVGALKASYHHAVKKLSSLLGEK